MAVGPIRPGEMCSLSCCRYAPWHTGTGWHRHWMRVGFNDRLIGQLLQHTCSLPQHFEIACRTLSKLAVRGLLSHNFRLRYNQVQYLQLPAAARLTAGVLLVLLLVLLLVTSSPRAEAQMLRAHVHVTNSCKTESRCSC